MKKLDLSVRTIPAEDYGQTALNDYAFKRLLANKKVAAKLLLSLIPELKQTDSTVVQALSRISNYQYYSANIDNTELRFTTEMIPKPSEQICDILDANHQPKTIRFDVVFDYVLANGVFDKVLINFEMQKADYQINY